MSLTLPMRRNRFKDKPKAETPKWQWPAFVVEWRSHVRRAALLEEMKKAEDATGMRDGADSIRKQDATKPN